MHDPTPHRRLLEEMIAAQPHRLTRVVRAADVARDDAEDVAQEILVRAVRSLGSVRGPADEALLCGWVATIAANVVRNYRRSLSRHPRPDDIDELSSVAAADDVHDQAVTAAGVAALHDLVAALPEDQRVVFVARAVEGRSTAEVAAGLGISEDLVRWRLRRARLRLQGDLAPYTP